MHIQDGALFFPQRLDLPESAAWIFCTSFIQHARTHGGVLTTIWHDRSHGPERFWGNFYVRLIDELKSQNVWFGTAGEVVQWFRVRRSITFERCVGSDGAERVRAKVSGATPSRPFTIRTHRTSHETTDASWAGDGVVELSAHHESERSFSGAI